MKNKKVLFLKYEFLGRCQYQNKKALFSDPIFSEGFDSGGPVSPMTDLITKVNAGGNDEETNGSSKGVKRVLVDIDNKKNSTKKRVKQ